MAESSSRLLSDPHLRRLLAMQLGHRRLLWMAIAAMVVTAMAEPTLAQLMGMLIDRGFFEREMSSALLVLAGVYGAFLLRALSQFTSSFLLNRVSQEILVDLRAQMFSRILQWPSATFERTPSGHVVSKFLNEATNALNLAAEVTTTAVRDTLVVIALLAFLLYKNWQLTLVTLVIAPVIAVILRLFSARLRRLNEQNQRMLGEMTRTVQEGFDGQRVVKLYDGYAYETGRFDAINRKLRGYAVRMQVAWSGSTPLTQMVAMTGIVTLIYFALMQTRSGAQSPGDFISFLTAAIAILNPLRSLAALNGPAARLAAGAKSVFDLIDSAPEDDSGTRTLARATGAVQFERVSFRYPDAQGAALDDFSLDVRPGEMIALVGPSGAGKTTVINLVPRFLDPTAGDVRLDGVPIRSLTLASLRRQIALVSQDVVLFDDTVRANIAYGAQRDATLERVREAARAAHLLELIESLPHGFDTPLGENAVKLSGGQRQRLSIARALLKDAPVLLLDEATSALDSESERAIQASLETLMQGRTTFVVAHRLSTIQRADRIVVLERGRIVEIGTHGALLAGGGLYAHLHSIQFAAAPA